MNIGRINNLNFKSVYYINGANLKPFEYRDLMERISKDTGLDYYVGEGYIEELHPCYRIDVKDSATRKFIESVKIDPDLLGWADDEDYIKNKFSG